MRFARHCADALLLIAAIAGFGCSAKRSELVAFTAVPMFREIEGKTYFLVSHHSQQYHVYWSYWRHPKPPNYPSHFGSVTLRGGHEYRFTFAFNDNTSDSADFHAQVAAEGAPRDAKGYFLPAVCRSATLTKIEENGQVLFDQDICPVRHRRMEVRGAPRVGGTLVAEEVATGCPHHGRFVLGGCLFDDRQRQPTLVCRDCANTYARYEMRWYIGRVISFFRSASTASQDRATQAH